MNLNQMFPSKYLKESDLGGQSQVYTIKAIVNEEVGDKNEIKPIIYFVESNKGVVVNVTKKEAINNAFGEDVEVNDLIGKSIGVRPGKTFFQGKITPCIDLFPATPPAPPPPVAEPPPPASLAPTATVPVSAPPAPPATVASDPAQEVIEDEIPF